MEASDCNPMPSKHWSEPLCLPRKRDFSLAVKRCEKICNNIRWRISQLNSILPRLGRSPSYLGTLGFGAPCSAKYPYVRDSAGDIYGTWGCLSQRTVNNDFEENLEANGPKKKFERTSKKKESPKFCYTRNNTNFTPILFGRKPRNIKCSTRTIIVTVQQTSRERE